MSTLHVVWLLGRAKSVLDRNIGTRQKPLWVKAPAVHVLTWESSRSCFVQQTTAQWLDADDRIQREVKRATMGMPPTLALALLSHCLIEVIRVTFFTQEIPDLSARTSVDVDGVRLCLYRNSRDYVKDELQKKQGLTLSVEMPGVGRDSVYLCDELRQEVGRALAELTPELIAEKLGID